MGISSLEASRTLSKGTKTFQHNEFFKYYVIDSKQLGRTRRGTDRDYREGGWGKDTRGRSRRSGRGIGTRGKGHGQDGGKERARF